MSSPRPMRLRAIVIARVQRCLMGVVTSTLISLPASAQTAPLTEGLGSLPARIRLGAERIGLPGDEHVGLVGTSYTLELVPSLWAGPAAYGAMTGQRGGLFTVGAEVGWQGPSLGPLSIGAGFYAGGGGGGSAPVGGGLMLRPHVDQVGS